MNIFNTFPIDLLTVWQDIFSNLLITRHGFNKGGHDSDSVWISDVN